VSATGWKGLGLDTLATAGVELDRGTVRVPYRDRYGRELYCKRFGRDGRSWYEPRGIRLVPFGLETLPPAGSRHPRYCALLLCEGESDTLAVRDVLARFRDHVLALALPGAGSWRDEWRSYVEPFPLVYVLGDGDDAGRRMNERVCAAVPWASAVWLPDGSDVRSLLQADAGSLWPLLARADEDARRSAALALSPSWTPKVSLSRDARHSIAPATIWNRLQFPSASGCANSCIDRWGRDFPRSCIGTYLRGDSGSSC
jgi:hypothetical protein